MSIPQSNHKPHSATVSYDNNRRQREPPGNADEIVALTLQLEEIEIHPALQKGNTGRMSLLTRC
jgi:hypothetical protein